MFSLSPAVTIAEYDLSVTVPNLPSSRTGMVLKADKGECLTIKAITSEADLIAQFGKPTADNYNNWFQAWNFLQYASSLYVVRPLPKNSLGNVCENAAVTFDGTSANWVTETNFYNKVVAENEMETPSLLSGYTTKLEFISKDITNDQDLAVAVCSYGTNFDKPIAKELFANVTSYASSGFTVTGSANINNFVKGTEFLGNFNKKFTVTTVTASGAGPTYQVATNAIVDKDFNKYVLTMTTSGVGDTTGTFGYNPNASIVEVGSFFGTTAGGVFSSASVSGFYVTGIVVSSSTSGTISYTTVNSTAPTLNASVSYSNKAIYTGNIAVTTATSGTVVTMDPGFTYVVGATIDVGATNHVIEEIDYTNNLIYLATSAGAITSGASSATTTYTFSVIATNGYDKYFGDSLIKRTRVVLDDGTYYSKQGLVTFDNLFEYQPEFIDNDEFVTVILKKNEFGKYDLSEQFLTSYNAGAKNAAGKNIFANQVFFNECKSLYCYVGSSVSKVNTHDLTLTKFENSDDTATTLYTTFTKGNIQDAMELFADAESFDINILLAHEDDLNGASEIAESRKDCVAIVAPCGATDVATLTTSTASDATTYMCKNYGTQLPADAGNSKEFGTFGTYSAVYGNVKYQYDKFNDVNRWISVAGDIAGLYAQTDTNRDPWWAPAGVDRGKIKNVIKLAFNPNKGNRDDLYYNSINPVVTITGEGTGIVYGQKTATKKPSAMDRVNVRRLLIVLEKAIATAARYSIFEFNDTFTRNRLKGIIEPYLRYIKSKRGLTDFRVVIDESNNTGQIIDSNALVIDLYLKPARVAEFIQLNAMILRSDASFTEIIGK
jgi:phage tail sheath protein FI